jgi:hypothetical protein
VIGGVFGIRDDSLRVKRDDGWSRTFSFDVIRRVLYRTRFNQGSALELFFKTGRTILLDMPGYESLPVLCQLRTVLPPNVLVQTTPFPEFFASMPFTQDWLKMRISNFTYLCILNLYSGRSYNSLGQYPIFPWVVVDFTSDVLDIFDPNIYRNVKKPMIAQGGG